MSAQDRPTPYAELIGVLRHLPILVRETRRRRGLSLRAAGREIGVSFSTVARAEAGDDLAMSSVLPLLGWVGESEEVS